MRLRFIILRKIFPRKGLLADLQEIKLKVLRAECSKTTFVFACTVFFMPLFFVLSAKCIFFFKTILQYENTCLPVKHTRPPTAAQEERPLHGGPPGSGSGLH